MKLSMVTACFNAEKNIEKTIKSVLNQTLTVYEYFIIDGKSSDKTVEIAESYRKQFTSKGIRYTVISENDSGISDAFNKGIRNSTGDLIGLINADDEMLPDTCKILYDSFRIGTDIYYGNCIWNESNNQLCFISKPKEQNTDRLYRLMYEMVMIHPATFITKRAYEKFGYYDVSFRYCMDEELLFRMYKNGVKFKYIDKELTMFFAGGLSDSNPGKVFHEASRIPIMYGEPRLKVKMIELKKFARDFIARRVKEIGIYKIIKKQVN